MVELTRYGPVLDLAIDTVKELTSRGEADVRIPVHPKAAGMAVDLNNVLHRLYPYIDSEIYFAGSSPVIVRGKPNERARQYRVRYRFVRESFEVPGAKAFSTYPCTTIIDLNDRTGVGYKTCISVDTQNKSKPQKNPNPFITKLMHGVELPPERSNLKLSFAYQSVSSFPVGTYFQRFLPLKRFVRPRAMDDGCAYPVSVKERHEIDRQSWEFFKNPVFWDSWSQYGAIAFSKMAGAWTYDDASRGYSAGVEHILRHAQKAETAVVNILQALKEKGDLKEVTEDVRCPPEYKGLYLWKILKSVGWLCNPDSLKDPVKSGYLENLSRACAEYGFHITPQELAGL